MRVSKSVSQSVTRVGIELSQLPAWHIQKIRETKNSLHMAAIVAHQIWVECSGLQYFPVVQPSTEMAQAVPLQCTASCNLYCNSLQFMFLTGFAGSLEHRGAYFPQKFHFFYNTLFEGNEFLASPDALEVIVDSYLLTE